MDLVWGTGCMSNSHFWREAAPSLYGLHRTPTRIFLVRHEESGILGRVTNHLLVLYIPGGTFWVTHTNTLRAVFGMATGTAQVWTDSFHRHDVDF
jgi:hypothetical protein